MRLLLVTTDPVLLSFARAVLKDAGIAVEVADQYTCAVEGALAIFPRRMLVPEAAWHRARRAMIDAGLEQEMQPDTVQPPRPSWGPQQEPEGGTA